MNRTEQYFPNLDALKCHGTELRKCGNFSFRIISAGGKLLFKDTISHVLKYELLYLNDFAFLFTLYLWTFSLESCVKETEVICLCGALQP